MTWVTEGSSGRGWKSSTVVAALLCRSFLKKVGGRSRAVQMSACRVPSSVSPRQAC